MSKLLTSVKKPVRSISGVIIVAVMTHPYPCPHGRCIYCPGGVSWGAPQSYVKDSPAVLRARRHDFDPYEQVRARLMQYVMMGHKPSKIELIVMGGTFPAMPLDYQEWFITQCLEAMNRFPSEKPNSWISLEEAQKRNEKASIRCVGLTIETRPDWAKSRHVDMFLRLGATRVELGVQTIYDDILERVRRGHTVEDTIIATQILKDAGYKVCYHIMLGLPGSDPDKDLEMFKTIFEDQRFRPDMLKIYPTLVIPGTELYEMWRRGEYDPYPDDVLIDLISKMKSIVPEYVRIMRIQRDIPASYIAAGPRIGNLREVVRRYMSRRGMRCRCIRCREVGHFILRSGKLTDGSTITVVERKLVYKASYGVEVFLSLVIREFDLLVGFLRLRIPSAAAHRREVNEKTAIIRELHVYGPQIPVGQRSSWWQHKGYGRKLMSWAERLAREEFDMKRMLVISGVGAREYYRKLGYRKFKSSFYMVKCLD